MSDTVMTWVWGVFILAVCLLISYAFAGAGHPNSLWFWRDILGVM